MPLWPLVILKISGIIIMEKNGKLSITEEEFEEFTQGRIASSLFSKGVTSLSQLQEIIVTGEYEIISA